MNTTSIPIGTARRTPNISPALLVQHKDYPREWHGRIPKRIRLQLSVTSGIPYLHAEAPKGASYDVWVNSHGAVSAILEDSKLLGLRPTEFKVIEWHDTEVLDIYNRVCRDLPEGYDIQVYMENGSGYVTLTDPSGDNLEFPNDYWPIDEQIESALNFALQFERGEL